MKRLFIAVLALLAAFGCRPKTEADRFVDDLMKQMTLREKLGQMVSFRS